MSDVVRDAQHEFWRPPVVQSQAARPGMVQACDGCGAEFMVGSLFCHACGNSREARASTAARWTLYLEFHNIKHALGLSTAALVFFFAGLVCLVMAGVAVGMIYNVQTFNDFHAVQLYRMQWLLGAIAAFVAGLLLKKAPGTKL
ncbi:MAG TPA: hypothetical protein VHS34_11735 [Terriglobales bacterium]|jgi:hypothetical protein|nr:hypothetical protein [Terriglobales bacterium]